MNADEFATYIQKAKKRNNYWTGLCPSHADKRPSLSWNDAVNREGVWVKCYSGCNLREICSALNMEVSKIYEGTSLSRPLWKGNRNKGKGNNTTRKENVVEKTIRKSWDAL